MITKQRIYYTKDRRLVTQDHPEALFLAYPVGATIDDKLAKSIIDHKETGLREAPATKQIKGKTKEQSND